jgi:hypothetical protein
MMLYLVVQIAMLVLGIAMIRRVWSVSAMDGILSLLIPLYVIVPMIKNRSDPDHDIRFHVLLFFLGAGVVVWMQYRLAHEVVAEQSQQAGRPMTQEERAQALAERLVGDARDGDPEADADRPQGAVEIGPATRAPRRAEPSSETSVRSREPDTPVSASAAVPAAPLTFERALATATFQRGVFERASVGFAIDLPGHFHALAAGDVRRIKESQHLPVDNHELAWVLHESVSLDSDATWHVSVRWLSDGWVPAPGALDAARLLQDAQRGPLLPRLAGSGGDLVGYAVAPSYSGGVADWVEERLPAGASASVLDCHALRLGRNGVVEFSVVGAAAGSQALCNASVRLLARNTRFEPGATYSPAATDAVRAPYSFNALVAGLR